MKLMLDLYSEGGLVSIILLLRYSRKTFSVNIVITVKTILKKWDMKQAKKPLIGAYMKNIATLL